ncbi:MAG: hypothetical protein PHY72_02625 [Candidatus Pacebacteria bacterium]|nr:hypothetical protein [Candidatus Paceibacterota bacterium]
MKIWEIREQLQNFPKYPGTKKYPPASVCNNGFPSCFNLSMGEAEMHELWGQYLKYDCDLIYSKIQPVIRHEDWQKILDDTENRYRYLSVFDMADVAGLILQKDNVKHREAAEFSISSMLSFIKSLGLDLNKIRVAYFEETNISKATNGKYKIDKNFPTDPMLAYWKENFDLKENQFIASHNRDTMLALNIFGLPTPWGYRNEIFYEHQGKLLDIGTTEHLMYAPVFNEQKEVVDIKPFDHSVVVNGVGVERISMIVNDIGNIWDVDTIKPLVNEAEKLFSSGEIEAMQIIQALRVIHRIIADCKSYTNLNKRRKEYLRGFFKVLPKHIDFNVENLKKIDSLLVLNSELQPFYPELKLSINQTLVELKQRKEAIDSDQSYRGVAQ